MEENTPTPEVTSIIPALPYKYGAEDERVNLILDEVAEFCGKEFTVVPPNPDGEEGKYPTNPPDGGNKEGGDIMPLNEVEKDTDVPHKPKPGDPDFVIDPDDPDKTGQIDPDVPGEKYPDGTGQEPNPDLDDLRDAYKEAKAKNLAEKESYWALLWQVIRLLSDATCWTDSYDDTFIYQHRSQTHDIKQTPRCCKWRENKCAHPHKFKLLYAPLDDTCALPTDDVSPMERAYNAKPFIGGELYWMDNDGKTQVVKIDQSYLNKHYNMHTQQVIIRAVDFPEALTYNNCECPQEVTLVLHYNAGYCGIPKALLPLVCQLLHKIDDSKTSINECAGAMTQVAGLLKSKKIGNIQYSWSDKDTEASKTQALFTQIYNLANVAELFSISRCDIINQPIAGDVI